MTANSAKLLECDRRHGFWVLGSKVSGVRIQKPEIRKQNPEPKMINHENTKFGKHEIFLFFRVFFLSCFRDKKVFS
jgi:hypothetical protein